MALKYHWEGHQTRLTNTHICDDEILDIIKILSFCRHQTTDCYSTTIQPVHKRQQQKQSTQTTLLMMDYNFFFIFWHWPAFKIEFKKDWKLQLRRHPYLSRYCSKIAGLVELDRNKADGWALSIGQSVLTHLQGPLKCPPPKHLNIAGLPGDDIPGQVWTAVSHGLDLGGLQNSVPNVHLTQLAHKSLSSIKVPAYHILYGPKTGCKQQQ